MQISVRWSRIRRPRTVASRAPEGAIGQATGAVQFVMFAGVVVVPPGFGVLVALTHSYATAFLAVAAVAMGTGLYLGKAYKAAADAP